MKPVGKPDAGNRPVRFDERGGETGRCRMAQATAPLLDSTHVARFCMSVERVRAGDPTSWIGVRPLAVQRIWG
jgi:hypothetical protein